MTTSRILSMEPKRDTTARARTRIAWCLLAAIVSGASFFALGSYVSAPPSANEMEERFAELRTLDEAPRSDIALALWRNLECIDKGKASQNCYARAISCYMALHAPLDASNLLHEARKRGVGGKELEATAQAYGLK